MYDPEGFLDLVKKTLTSRAPSLIETPLLSHFRHAGVLIPLYKEDDRHYVLFTKRTDTVEHHKGQISFPGGSVDQEDASIKETALREAREEIGLFEEDVEVLGRLDDLLTLASEFIVHPVVGIIPSPYEFKLNPFEVKRLIRVPWEELVSQDLEDRVYQIESDGQTYLSPAYEHNGDLIWGATARMIKNFISIINKKSLEQG